MVVLLKECKMLLTMERVQRNGEEIPVAGRYIGRGKFWREIVDWELKDPGGRYHAAEVLDPVHQ